MIKKLAVLQLPILLLLLVVAKTFNNSTPKITLNTEQLRKIGHKIWFNESCNDPNKLLFWNPKEEFPSFGIGHFIWLPCSCNARFEQTFPALIDFMVSKKIVIPSWLDPKFFPWNNREDFMQKRSSDQSRELQQLLLHTLDTQVEFMVHRLETALKSDAIKNNKQLLKQFNLLLQTPQGIFALIDYTNFKGTGLNANERYDNKGWGLVHVLESTHSNDPGTALKQFITQAESLLRLRVKNSPPERNEAQFLTGWLSRIHMYKK